MMDCFCPIAPFVSIYTFVYPKKLRIFAFKI